MASGTAYIVDAVRTPVGRRRGGLSSVHPADLSAHVLRALVERTSIDPGAVDDVIWGAPNAVGAQAGNIARTSWLSAGYPEHVPGVSVDRRCGSSQQAVTFAAQAIASGAQDLVVAGGVEVMSLIPLGAAAVEGLGAQYGGAGWIERYGTAEVTQFRGAEMIAERWGVTRGDMEQFALVSHERAVRAQQTGRFDAEVTPTNGIERDEGPRPDTSLEKMASMPPLIDGGRLTAAVSSPFSDAAAALLLASEEALHDHGLTPRARVHTSVAVGSDPITMLTGPIPATQRVLERAKLSLDDIDLFEVNEAFASVVLAWLAETHAPTDRVNVNGGAIALGHPVGATGARLMTTMVNELEKRNARYGLQVMCEGGGTANATIIELV